MRFPNYGDLVTTTSILLPTRSISVQTQEELRVANIENLVANIRNAERGSRKFTIRDILPSDLGFPNNAWNEQAGSTENAWEATQVSSDELADDTWVTIWAVQDRSEYPVYSALRFEIGGARIQQVSLSHLWNGENGDLPREGFLMTPIMISPNKSITVYGYVAQGMGRVGSVELQYIGAVAEFEGKTIRP